MPSVFPTPVVTIWMYDQTHGLELINKKTKGFIGNYL